jgi:hypothetical protein
MLQAARVPRALRDSVRQDQRLHQLAHGLHSPVHGELLIKRRPVCGKGHDSELARRTAVAGRFGAQHDLAVRPELSP